MQSNHPIICQEIIPNKTNKFRSLFVGAPVNPQIKSCWLNQTNKIFNWNEQMLFHYRFDVPLLFAHGHRIYHTCRHCNGYRWLRFVFMLMLRNGVRFKNKQFFYLPSHKFSHAWHTFRSSNVAFWCSLQKKRLNFFREIIKINMKTADVSAPILINSEGWKKNSVIDIWLLLTSIHREKKNNNQHNQTNENEFNE